MPWISLDDAKAQLNETTTDAARDSKITGYVNAACAAIELVKGHVDAVKYTNVIFDADELGRVILPELPVASVDAVSHVLDGGTADSVPEADPLNGVPTGWVFNDGAKLTVPGWRWRVAVSYTAGYPDDASGASTVPANIRQAALDLTEHLWERSQLNGAGSRPGVDLDPETIPGIANAMPYAVRELLGLFGKTVRDEVFIA